MSARTHLTRLRARRLLHFSTRKYTTNTHITIKTPKGTTISCPSGLYINGDFIPSSSGKKIPSINPSTGETFAHIYEADAADVDKAVSAAQLATTEWAKISPQERGRIMFRFCDLVEAQKDTFAEIESMDNGKALKDMYNVDIPDFLGVLRYYAGWSDKIYGQHVDVDPNFHTYTKHEPLGVVGQILPFNYPMVMAAWKLGPALATGNTIVLKSSEKTPLTALYMCQMWEEAGLPKGVLNVLSGSGAAGHALAFHMDVQKIAFTGSTATGRKVMEAAAKSNLKKVSLELGGKSAQIVFEDADLDQSAYWVSRGIFDNMGQNCNAGSRVFVHESIHDVFVEKLRAEALKLRVGDPFTDVEMGPLVDEIQFKKVLGMIEDGKRSGARVVTGGDRKGTKGFFVNPTVFSEVKDSMKIATDEIFGPVIVVLKFKDFDDVISRANASPYGLAGGVHTKSIKTAFKAVNALKAGTIWANMYNITHHQMPFGGFKSSGIGRELGSYALQEYTEVKSVYVNLE
ncbi:hypothetical protein SmJEL517_g04021 [Synchytrium microbalum]|uniref:Aldehyde dehydrogenase domain-containing protein n=1 Tax=Synchytrium microbalum TaxID=1806994 RepID=A0A507C1U2_9FUNG|nr:uncharacterized protein SmJEL517_g04021 [Synchytrium microbalum]TPX33029.1 hypothetical protein SmJEL517_g04021 [Synchytrium microbalum]